MKRIIKILILAVLHAFYKTVSLVYREKGMAFLMYHSIGNNDHNFMVRPEDFERQIKYLKDHNFKFLKLQDIAQVLEGVPVFEKGVAITFDDGYKDFFDIALPILKKYDVSSVLFVHADRKSDNLENELNLMSWEDIKRTKESGVEIGSHTYSHPNLKELTEEEIKFEIDKSEEVFQDKLGEIPKTIAYPGGKFTEKIIDAFKKRGYELGFTIDRGLLKKRENPFRIKRNGIEKQTSFLEFKIRISGANNWYDNVVNSIKKCFAI